MKYLKVENAGSMDRRYLYFLGGGDKQGLIESSYIIGHRGTGLKLAIIGALKLGLSLIITSVDSLGPYKMVPKVRPFSLGDQIFHQIIYVYMRPNPFPWWKKLWLRLFYTREAVEHMNKIETMVETPYTIEAFKDWTVPIGKDTKAIFKTAREIIANAHDADPDWKHSYIDSTDVVCAMSDETIVYLENTDELEAMLSPEEVNRYFKIFAACPPALYYKPDVGVVYPRADPDMTRLFVRGTVSAVTDEEFHTSCFDYVLYDHKLWSEEKEVKDITNYMYRVGALLETIADVSLATTILEEVARGRAQFEVRSVLWKDDTPAPSEDVRYAYYQAWMQSPAFGPHLIFSCGNQEFDHRAVQMGYKIVHYPMGPSGFRSFLKSCGIQSSYEVVPKQGQMDFLPASESDLDPMQLVVHQRARQLLYQYFPGALQYPIRLLKSKTGGNVVDICGIAGELDSLYKEICLNIAHPYFNTLSTHLEILLHEYFHCVSKATDFTALFIKAAVQGVVAMIFKSEIERNRHVKPKSP